MTIKASHDVVELYLIRVPLFKEASSNGHTETVTDHTGKPILYLKIRIISHCEYYDERENTRSRYSTIIDVVGLDGTTKGQVATDVTAGCYARSRLANSSDTHWATIKSAKKKGQDKLGVDNVFSFKVVPTFNEVHIGTVASSETCNSTHEQAPTKHDTRTFEVTASRGEDSKRPKHMGKIIIVGIFLHTLTRTRAHIRTRSIQTCIHINTPTQTHTYMCIYIYI